MAGGCLSDKQVNSCPVVVGLYQGIGRSFYKPMVSDVAFHTWNTREDNGSQEINLLGESLGLVVNICFHRA